MSTKLLRSTTIYLAANIISASIPFLLLPFLTRVLEPESYGLIAMYEALIVFLSAFTGVNIHGAVSVRYYKSNKTTFPDFVSTCVAILAFTSLSTIILMIFLKEILFKLTNITVYWLILAALVASGQFIINIRLAVWQASKNALSYGIFQIIKVLLDATLSIILLTLFIQRAEGRMLGLSIAIISMSILALITLRRNGILRGRWRRQYVVEALKFGIPLIPHTIGGITVMFADRFILKSAIGLEATGLYFAAMQLAAPLRLLGTSFNRAFTPWLYEKLAKNQDASAIAASYTSMLFFIIFGCLYAASIHFATPLLLGEKYQTLRHIEPFLIFGGVFQAMYFSVVNYIFYISKTAYLSAITILSGVSYILVGWSLTKLFGFLGLAITYFGTQVVIFLSVWLLSAKISKKPWFEFSAIRIVVFAWINHFINIINGRQA